jgi:hypothetical protein
MKNYNRTAGGLPAPVETIKHFPDGLKKRKRGFPNY